ncbi:MAG: RDD family protein [Nocardioides sp.]
MTGMEAGWYRDPAPPHPAFPTTLRYWDGSGWTTRVKNASRAERQAWQQEIAAARAEQAAQAWEHAVATGTLAPEQVALATAASNRQYTPDGQRLSGWWRRVGATFVDGLVTSALGLALSWHWVVQIRQAYADYISLVLQSAQAHQPMPDQSALTSRIAGPLLVTLLIFWGLSLVYNVGFLKAFAATPGKMALGIEVRLRERRGPLSWGTVLARWFGQNVGGLLSLVPVVGTLGGIYSLIDVLWPLWDGRRQALHDKIARTNVVRRSA